MSIVLTACLFETEQEGSSIEITSLSHSQVEREDTLELGVEIKYSNEDAFGYIILNVRDPETVEVFFADTVVPAGSGSITLKGTVLFDEWSSDSVAIYVEMNNAANKYSDEVTDKEPMYVIDHVLQPNPLVKGNLGDTTGKIIDERDDQEYSWVLIDSTRWMAENLNYGTVLTSCNLSNERDCDTYGQMYNWFEANGVDSIGLFSSEEYGINQKSHQGICPEGWIIPSKAFWLIFSLKGWGAELMEPSDLWDNNIGTNTTLFSARPSGYKENNRIKDQGEIATWWSSSSYHYKTASISTLKTESPFTHIGAKLKSIESYVRCIQQLYL